MELLSIVVLKEKLEGVTLRLLKLGIFHPVDIRNIEEGLKDLSPFQIDKEYSEWDNLEAKLKDILRKLALKPIVKKEIKEFSYDGINRTFSDIEERSNPLLVKKDELQEELKTKETMFSQMKAYPSFLVKRESPYSFLEVSLGKIDEKNTALLERSFKDIPHIIYPFQKEGEKLISLFIGLRRDRVLIEKVLKDLAWERIEYSKCPDSLSKDVTGKISFEIQECRNKIKDADEEIKRLGDGCKENLFSIESFITLKKSILDAKRYSCATEKTVVLSGWVPLEEKENVIREIKKIDSISYMEAKDAEDVNVPKDEIPVKLKHATFFKPFELLITSYGIPRYGSIDPTIFVAMSFLLMFGAMFGDLGHGLVLGLASLFLRKSKNEKVKQAGALITYCGISSAIFGVLYGSFFGLEFPSIWLKPMKDIMQIFKISIIFGIGVISVGVLLNVVNALRDKDYLKAIFDKAGLIGGIIYWAAIGLVSKLFVSKAKIPPVYLYLIFAGVILLFLKPFIESIFERERSNLLVGLIEGTVDILEIAMGYLANTVSFIRIAAFSLAHAGLFLAIFELSRIVNNNSGAFMSFLVVILGNILIILLEGLVVSIQSLRLNYYEFFSKFFMAGKQSYKPMTI